MFKLSVPESKRPSSSNFINPHAKPRKLASSAKQPQVQGRTKVVGVGHEHVLDPWTLGSGHNEGFRACRILESS